MYNNFVNELNTKSQFTIVFTLIVHNIDIKNFVFIQFFSHYYHPNRRLERIEKLPNGEYNLTFIITSTVSGYTQDTTQSTTVCAKRVILAMPPKALNTLDWPPFKTARTYELINSVRDDKASKVFLLYQTPWWRNLPADSLRRTVTKSDLPNRQTYDFGVSSSGKAVLLVSYTDGEEDVVYWRLLQSLGKCRSKVCDSTMVTDEVIKHAHMHLSKIYNISISSIPQPLDGIMQHWDIFPFFSGWGYWKPGVNFMNAMEDILKPNTGHEIYILNGQYTTRMYQSWGEGVLLSGDILLQKYFGIQPFV